MKAEHRKELETNVLADRVGRALQSMKQRPKKRAVFWILLIVAVVVGLWIWVRRGQLASEDNSKRWLYFLHNDYRKLSDRDNAGKAARFDAAWWFLWDKGIKSLGREHVTALKMLDDVEEEYLLLTKLCKDDPVYLPEALYALAVIEEARAIRDRAHLKKAVERYHDVADKHKDSAFGKLALERLEVLEDKNKREEIERFYYDLQEKWKVPDAPRGLDLPDKLKDLLKK